MPNKINPKNLTKMESQILETVDVIEELSSLTDPTSSCDSESSSSSQTSEKILANNPNITFKLSKDLTRMLHGKRKKKN
jgi:hypothetical protein